MGDKKIIFTLIFITLLVGISCVSAQSIDDATDMPLCDDNSISVDENDVLADSSDSVTVYDWTELGSAVSSTNNISTVYLGANITPGNQILIGHNVTIIGSADTYIGGDASSPVSYSTIPIYSTASGLSITLKNIRFQNCGGNILMKFSGNGNYVLENCYFEKHECNRKPSGSSTLKLRIL